ncbi:hypothetical protein PMAYCL1PPCAC_16115, partial [Pristionchus mayeri]
SGCTSPLFRNILLLVPSLPIRNPCTSSQSVGCPIVAGMQNDNPSLDALPWPPFNRICNHLRTDGDCENLANFSVVSRSFRSGVKEFMKRANNRPGLDLVKVARTGAGLEVEIRLYPSNIPFYDLDALDSVRFHREGTTLRVTLSGPEDPIFEQVVSLLSAPVRRVAFADHFSLSCDDLELSAQLLQSRNIRTVGMFRVLLNDTTAPSIVAILKLATEGITMQVTRSRALADPAAFITQLGTLAASSMNLHDFTVPFLDPEAFIGIPYLFWENYFNENLSNGTIDYVCTAVYGARIRR